jgi:hypothetical protein
VCRSLQIKKHRHLPRLQPRTGFRAELRAPAAPSWAREARIFSYFRSLRLATWGFSGCGAHPAPRKTRSLNP